MRFLVRSRTQPPNPSGVAAQLNKKNLNTTVKIDCEQSLFFFRFSERGLAMHARVAICVSRVLLDGLQKKERLLVVYSKESGM